MQYQAMDQPVEAADQHLPMLPYCPVVLAAAVLWSINWPMVRELRPVCLPQTPTVPVHLPHLPHQDFQLVRCLLHCPRPVMV